MEPQVTPESSVEAPWGYRKNGTPRKKPNWMDPERSKELNALQAARREAEKNAPPEPPPAPPVEVPQEAPLTAEGVREAVAWAGANLHLERPVGGPSAFARELHKSATADVKGRSEFLALLNKVVMGQKDDEVRGEVKKADGKHLERLRAYMKEKGYPFGDRIRGAEGGAGEPASPGVVPGADAS